MREAKTLLLKSKIVLREAKLLLLKSKIKSVDYFLTVSILPAIFGFCC